MRTAVRFLKHKNPTINGRKKLKLNYLQIQVLRSGCFCPKIEAVLQKNGGPTEIILHFFSRFPGFLGCFPLQAIAIQPQAPLRPLQEKSCQKTYHRFFVHSALCHNRRVNERTVQWEKIREKPRGGPPGRCSASKDMASTRMFHTRLNRPTQCKVGRGSRRAGGPFRKMARPEPRPTDVGNIHLNRAPTAIQPGPLAVGTSQ